MPEPITPPIPVPAPAPAAVVPPAGDPPAPVATPPAPAPRAAAPAPKKPADRPAPFDQHPGFRKRVDQEAARVIKKALGISLDDAIVKLAASSEPAPAPPAGGTPAGAPPARDKRVEKILSDNQRLTSRIEKLKKKVRKVRTAARDQLLDLEIKHDALRAGIKEADVDFAVNLFRQACLAGGENPPDTMPFFSGLRTTRAYLFADGTPVPPVMLKPTTAPPESLAPGEAKPNQSPPAAQPPGVDVDKMTDQEFAAHKRSHGWNGY